MVLPELFNVLIEHVGLFDAFGVLILALLIKRYTGATLVDIELGEPRGK